MRRPVSEDRAVEVLLGPAKTEGKKYLNPVPTAIGGLRMAFRVLPLYLSNREERVPRIPPGPFLTDARVYEAEPGSGLRVTWFGHSASLVEIDGLRVLIDPVWEERASPAQWFGPKRFFPPTIPLAELPSIDIVLLSHDHYDHLGESTVRLLAKLACTAEARWVTSAGVGADLVAWGVPRARLTELNWTEAVEVRSTRNGCTLRLRSLPARHFSGRSLSNRFETLWASFVLEGSRHRVYFGADSGWWPGFAAIGTQFGPFDLTMLEIGAYNELWKQIHLGPDGAAQAFTDLGSTGLLMPIHWGLFDLALHAWRQPIERMAQLARERGLPLWSPEPGRPTEVRPGEPTMSDWWRSGGIPQVR